MTNEEATAFKALLAELLVRIKDANQQMTLDQIGIERLRVETTMILADIQKRADAFSVEEIFRNAT